MGFKKFIWIFSGRRGVHCWISNPQARCLPNEARSAIADYLSVVSSEGQVNKSIISSIADPNFDGLGIPLLHPSVESALKIMRPHFEEKIFPEQIIASEQLLANFLAKFDCEDLKNDISAQIQKFIETNFVDEKNLWNHLENNVFIPHLKGAKKKNCSRSIFKEIVISYCYPKLDAEVTKVIFLVNTFIF